MTSQHSNQKTSQKPTCGQGGSPVPKQASPLRSKGNGQDSQAKKAVSGSSSGCGYVIPCPDGLSCKTKMKGCTQMGFCTFLPAGVTGSCFCMVPGERRMPTSSTVSLIHVSSRLLSFFSFLPPGNEKWPDHGSNG